MSRGFSPAATAAFITTLVVLGLIGWSIGWLAADTEPKAHSSPSASASPSPRQSTTPSRTPTAGPTSTFPTDAFEMPNFVDRPFRDARADAIDAKLDVRIRFGESGKNGTVRRTNPTPGTLVRPGYEIVLFVAGDPPEVIVPLIAARTCANGTAALIDVGLQIDGYPTGQSGRVVKTDPPALTKLKWNDKVKVYCGS